MPKLLFFCYKFPPVEASSCIRAAGLTKYLVRAGWQITVVTPDPQLVSDQVFEERPTSPGLRRLITGHRWNLLLQTDRRRPIRTAAGALCRRLTWKFDIENSIGWLPAADAACRRLSPKDVDVVLATGPPFTTFRVAARVARRLGRPLVLDYRDPWTANWSRYAVRQPSARTIQCERRLLEAAAAATIVTPSWGRLLRERFDVGSKVHVIGNGFDPEEMAAASAMRFDRFAIVYAGVLYPPRRSAAPLMEALQRLRQQTAPDADAWRFHYFGPHTAHVHHEAQRRGVEQQVVLHGLVPRRTAVAAIKGADVAVVITSTASDAPLRDLGIVTGKIYEPVGLGTPVLLIGPTGSDARAVVDSASGASFVPSQVDAMAAFLQRQMAQASAREPSVPTEHSWPSLAGRFSDLLETVAFGPATRRRPAHVAEATFGVE